MSSQSRKVETAVFQKPKNNQFYCGDCYFYTETDNEYICAIADGLGSGWFARESANIVIDVLKNNLSTSSEQLIRQCNKKLSGKRGAVAGILRINFKTSSYSFSSIGNIGLLAMTGDKRTKRSISAPGYLNQHYHPFKVEQNVLENRMNFLLFSDGITDEDLSQDFFKNQDVHQVIQELNNYTYGVSPKDDMTLLAIKYDSKAG